MRFKTSADVLTHLATIAAAIPDQKWRLAAAIVRRGEILSIGINTAKSHPLQAKYAVRAGAIAIHAEVAALKGYTKLYDVDDLHKCTLYVCRVKRPDHKARTWEWGNSRPCPACTRAIDDFGIGAVVHSLDGVGNFDGYSR